MDNAQLEPQHGQQPQTARETHACRELCVHELRCTSHSVDSQGLPIEHHADEHYADETNGGCLHAWTDGTAECMIIPVLPGLMSDTLAE